jgi:hypothetical protein
MSRYVISGIRLNKGNAKKAARLLRVRKIRRARVPVTLGETKTTTRKTSPPSSTSTAYPHPNKPRHLLPRLSTPPRVPLPYTARKNERKPFYRLPKWRRRRRGGRKSKHCRVPPVARFGISHSLTQTYGVRARERERERERARKRQRAELWLWREALN